MMHWAQQSCMQLHAITCPVSSLKPRLSCGSIPPCHPKEPAPQPATCPMHAALLLIYSCCSSHSSRSCMHPGKTSYASSLALALQCISSYSAQYAIALQCLAATSSLFCCDSCLPTGTALGQLEACCRTVQLLLPLACCQSTKCQAVPHAAFPASCFLQDVLPARHCELFCPQPNSPNTLLPLLHSKRTNTVSPRCPASCPTAPQRCITSWRTCASTRVQFPHTSACRSCRCARSQAPAGHPGWRLSAVRRWTAAPWR